MAHLFADRSFLYHYIQFQPEVIRDVFVILRNLLEKKEDLADQTNITKLLKIILFSQNLQTQLFSHTKKLNGKHSTSSSDDEGDHSKDKKPHVNEAHLISLVSAWFKLINLILNKEKPTSGNKQPYLQLQETMKNTLKTTFKYYG